MPNEMRIALRNVGTIDPLSLRDYMAAGGYQALKKAVATPRDELIAEIEKSGRLRGRGGAGFNTGLKWRNASQAKSDKKYVVCNADEGEPGTYKDRVIMENDPHTVLEGMLICAHAIGADEAYIYCRGEYGQSLDALRRAVADVAKENVAPGVTFRIVSGAGSYICGEETALIESIEGKRGEPRLKPPYPTDQGLFGKPTVVNNVETFAAIPVIVEKGAAWFSGLGVASYPGTKILSLSGDVENKRCFEVTTDATVRDIVYGFGGGIPGGKKLKAVQVGGSSCAFMTDAMLDTPVDFDSMRDVGASLGSGAVLVFDETRDMVDILSTIADFFKHESCGKCVACREGSARTAELVERIASGAGSQADIDALERLAKYMQTASFCPMGQSVATPVLSALALFPEDFQAKLNKGGV